MVISADEAAIEVERDIDLYRMMAARIAGGSVFEGPCCSWVHNPMELRRSVIFRLNFPEDKFDVVMRELIDSIISGAAPSVLVTTPRSLPVDLEQRLPAWSFTPIMAQTGMWLELASKDFGAPDLRLARIEDGRGMDAWVKTVNRGFGRADNPGLHRLLLDDPSLSFYGLFDGSELVTTVFRHVRGEVVGLHTIATPPEWRGRGYATIATRSALAISAAEGQKLAVLQASKLGQPVYERIGFIPCGELRQWKYQGSIS